MNLPLRILLGYFLVVGLAAFFVLRIFVGEVQPSVREAIEETMVDSANILAVMAADELRAGRIGEGEFAARIADYRRRGVDAPIWHFRKSTLDFRVTVTDADGIVRFDSDQRALGADHSRWNDVYRTLRGEYGARSTRDDPDDDGSSVFYVAAPVRDGERIIGVLTLAKPVRTVQPIITRSEQTILKHGFWLMGGAALIGLLVTLWLTGSIRRLRHYAQAVAAGEAANPPLGGGQELSDLARAMEAMRQKLEGKQYVEQTVQALTHELKSPLAALRGAGEILAEAELPAEQRQRFAGHVLSQSARMQECVERMLSLSRLEAGRGLGELETLEATELLDDLCRVRQPRADAQGISFETLVPATSIALRGERERLLLALGNLLDNALDHAPADSLICLSASIEASECCFRIRDQGEGIPDYALPHLFERFYGLPRPDGSKGSGLGLAIAQEVARLHGGSVSLANHPEGGVEACLRVALG
ncbi:two-component system sensor histidine kinase CreC [Uliginosibacterium aquaticum]|uniref:histidine kinase n=1 Tax=Uliginosibacterium aquaticum TaxID=2731212 RepID=A0ABX2IGA3_9RHOO|nr:two-component system sensor histidine kinase CreC [Uliginosibacterium aquaticum]NSL55801.1 two-component system sensor histidine kinase CreC [Uliginosibacterium aquaticum]